MFRSHLFLLAAVGVGCMPTGSYQGKLVDAMTGDVLPDVRLLAKSMPVSRDMTCQTFDALTSADGSFTVQGLCGSDTYLLEPGLLPMEFVIDEGGWEARQERNVQYST